MTLCAAAAVGLAAVAAVGHAAPAAAPATAAATPATLAAPATPASDQRVIDAAVERGLGWLARTQNPRGHWSADVGHKQQDDYLVYHSVNEQERRGTGHVGVSAFAGLAFLASGHTPSTGPWARVVDAVTNYVVACADEDEYITDSFTNMYGHAFATLYLSQVAGMTAHRHDRVLKTLRTATHFIVSHQNAVGGWRYSPDSDEADLSVTVCQVQALRAARDAGIAVPQAAIQRVLDYLANSRIPTGGNAGCFYYKITGRAAFTKTSFAVNAAATTALQSAGVYTEDRYGRALRYLEDNYAEVNRHYPTHFYYWYGNYYATQALHMQGGPRFRTFYDRIARDLISRQQPDGRWKNDTGPGDVFATAVACLILQVPGANLPIFQN